MQPQRAPAITNDAEIFEKLLSTFASHSMAAPFEAGVHMMMGRATLDQRGQMNFEDQKPAIILAANNTGSFKVYRDRPIKLSFKEKRAPVNQNRGIGPRFMSMTYGVGAFENIDPIVVPIALDKAHATVDETMHYAVQIGENCHELADDMCSLNMAGMVGTDDHYGVATHEDYGGVSAPVAANATRAEVEAHYKDHDFLKFMEDMRDGSSVQTQETPQTILSTWDDPKAWKRGYQAGFDGLMDDGSQGLKYKHFIELNRLIREQNIRKRRDVKTAWVNAPVRAMMTDVVGGKTVRVMKDGGPCIFVSPRVLAELMQLDEWEKNQQAMAGALGEAAGFSTGKLGMLHGFTVIASEGIPTYQRGDAKIDRCLIPFAGAMAMTFHNQSMSEEYTVGWHRMIREIGGAGVPIQTSVFSLGKRNTGETGISIDASMTPHQIIWKNLDGEEDANGQVIKSMQYIALDVARP